MAPIATHASVSSSIMQTTTPTTTTSANPDDHPSQPPASSQASKKRKRKDTEKQHILHQSTFRKPTWTYFHLCLITPNTTSSTTTSTSTSPSTPLSATEAIDPLTVSPLFASALTSYLGTTGSAIPLDILKTAGRAVWIRVPRQDARAVRAALSGWIGACEAENIPGVMSSVEGVGGGKRVQVAWRIVREEGTVLGVSCGDGGELFGG